MDVSDWSGRCLGELGAFEPFLLPRKISRQSSLISPFAFTIKDESFAKAALYELIRAFQSEKYTKVCLFEITFNYTLSFKHSFYTI